MDILSLDGWQILLSEIAAYRLKERPDKRFHEGFKGEAEIILKSGQMLEGYALPEDMNKILAYWSKQ